MRVGAIILCGGKSSRMGRDKATLPFGPESMLQRVVRLTSAAVSSRDIVVVAAPEQVLPTLPHLVRVVRDEFEDRGPMEGLAAGLRGLVDVDAAFVTSCDVPLLAPAFVSKMFDFLGEFEIAAPRDGERLHPLGAVYRTSVLPQVMRLLEKDQLRLRAIFDEVRTREVPVDELRSADPDLSTLKNLNSPEDYHAALVSAGLPMPLDRSQPASP